MTYPDSKTATYTYLANGAMSTVTDWLNQQTAYTYNDAGMLTKTQLPNGVWTDYTYDNADRLTSVANKKPGPVTISSFTYTLDATGNRTQMADLSGTHSYQYDALYRLTQVTYPGPQSDAYTYDAVGNRLTKNATAYTYDNADEMLTAGGVAYGYDSNGNQASRGSDTFAYDHENRLTQSVIGGATSSSMYNGDGLRMSHTVGGQATNYTWDINASMPLVLQDGTNTYVYGLDLISATDASGAQTYFTYDGLGSTTDLTDGSGNVTGTYSYDVFGAIRAQTGGGSNYWLFTGEQKDSDSSLYFLRARYYDPATGRFLGQDPLGIGNRYSYVGNSPINFNDRSGLCFGLGNCGPIDDADNVLEDAYQAGDDVVPYISQGVQIADLLPVWGSIPFVNIPATFISWPLDVGAFGFSLYDIWTSECSFKTNLSLTLNSGVNLGAGIAGQGLADLASPSVIGPAIISVTVSAIETSLYAANALALSQCEEGAQLSLQKTPASKAPLTGKE